MALSTVYDVAALGVVAATLLALFALDWPKAYTLAVGIIATTFVQFVAEWQTGTSLGIPALALVADRFASGEDLWSVVTYAFLHGGLAHLFGNLFILVTAGPALEDSTGPWWFLGIYWIAALASAAAGIVLGLYTDVLGAGTSMVGASGAIFGILTAYAIRHPREKLPIILIFVFWFPAMGVLLIYLAFNVALMLGDFAGGNVSTAWFGHFAGFLVGLVFANRAGSRAPTTTDAAFDPDRYAHLATTARGRDALANLADVRPGEEAVAVAWLDVLADESSCPTCGTGLERRRLRLRCPNGHRLGADDQGE